MALEDIARYPLPQDELALQRDETPTHEYEYPVSGGPVVANGVSHVPNFSSFPSDFTSAAVARADVEDDVTQRFSSPAPREVSLSRK